MMREEVTIEREVRMYSPQSPLLLLPHYRQYHVTRAAAGLAPDIYPSSEKSLWVQKEREKEQGKIPPLLSATVGV